MASSRVRISQNRLMGTVLSWKGRFGWIRSDKKINHEEAVKHGGRVYVHISDVEGRMELQENARVSFMAYSDGDGLGAEQVQIEIQNLSHQTNEIAGVATVVKTRQRPAPSGPPPTGMAVPAPKQPAAEPKPLFQTSGVAPKAWPLPKPSVKAKVLPKAPKTEVIPTGWDDEDRPQTAPASSAEVEEPARRWRFQGASAPPVEVSPAVAPPVAKTPPAAKAAPAKAPPAKAPPAKASSTMDGMTMASEAAANYVAPPGTVKWWKDLAGDCCPISLSPLEELTVDPFGLIGATEGDEKIPSAGVWGKAAERLVGEEGQQSVHWFDGMFLASFLVSSGQLIDPVNRRSLTRGECKSLDEYIQAHGFPAVHVTDAFDLAKAVSQTTQSDGPAATRMAALEREAASMLRSLFDFRSVGSAGMVHPQPSPATPSPAEVQQTATPSSNEVQSGNDATGSEAIHWPALGQSIERPAVTATTQREEGERRIRVCTQRTVHNDGGLQVVDDTEFDVEYEEEIVSEPTLAESAASAPRRSRLARLPRGRNDGAQITFAVTGRARVDRVDPPERGRNAAPPSDSESEESENTGALEVETWIPEWATPELHERLLSELEVIEAMFPDEVEILTPEVKIHLEECLSKGIVCRASDQLRVQISQHLDGPKGGCTVAMEFSMPPFYPLHNATVVLGYDDDAPIWQRDGLMNLQTTLRTEVLPSFEGSEVIQKVIDWLNMHGPAALSASEREASDPKRRAKREEQAQAAETPATKAERIEQARKERLSAKFTEKWDLCYAFVKHGSCKDKNCQWRHELPKKEEKEEKTSDPKSEEAAKSTKANAGPGKSTAKAGGKKKR